MMTRTEFVERHRHEIAGLVLDAATHGKHGSELAAWLRGVMRVIDTRLMQMHAELTATTEEVPPNANGKPVPRRATD